jgi:hypothetical protein
MFALDLISNFLKHLILHLIAKENKIWIGRKEDPKTFVKELSQILISSGLGTSNFGIFEDIDHVIIAAIVPAFLQDEVLTFYKML